MKSSVIKRMMCSEFNVDERDIEVNFIDYDNEDWKFQVNHYPKYDGKPWTKIVKISITEKE